MRPALSWWRSLASARAERGGRWVRVEGGWRRAWWRLAHFSGASDHLLEFAIAQARMVEPQVRQPRRRRALQRQHSDVGGVRRLPRLRFPGARRHRRRRRRRPRRVLEFTHAGEAIGGEGAGGDVAGQAEVAGRRRRERRRRSRKDGCGEGGERSGWEGGGHRAHQLGAVGMSRGRRRARVREKGRARTGKGRQRMRVARTGGGDDGVRRVGGRMADRRRVEPRQRLRPRRARRQEGAGLRVRGAEPCVPSATPHAAASAAPGRRRVGVRRRLRRLLILLCFASSAVIFSMSSVQRE